MEQTLADVCRADKLHICLLLPTFSLTFFLSYANNCKEQFSGFPTLNEFVTSSRPRRIETNPDRKTYKEAME